MIGGPKSARSPDEGILLSPPSDARGNDIINSSSDVNLQTRAKGKTHEGKNGEKRIVLGSEREREEINQGQFIWSSNQQGRF